MNTPLLFCSFGWGEILIIAFILIVIISIIIIGSKSSSRRLRSYLTADELAKLADLRDRGVITNEEFEAQKKKLLK